MQHPIDLRVNRKGNIISQIIPRTYWDKNFIDCSQMFFPIMPYGQIFSKFDEWPKIEHLNLYKIKNLTSFTGAQIEFILQKGRRSETGFHTLYEPRIFLTGEVRTRQDNWHDFFNAIIWNTFPKTKAVLNMRQFIAYDEQCDFPWKYPQTKRIREQEYLTMFDEGGCIIAESNINSKPFIFGHASYERILYGDRDLSMCCLKIKVEKSFFDLTLQNQLQFLDDSCSKLLFFRSTYTDNPPFFSFSLDSAEKLLINFMLL